MQMKTKFTRRKFLQTAAVTTTAAMLPGITGAASQPPSENPVSKSAELPKRRLGRTNRMVSCIGFGSGSRYCNWVADDVMLQKHIDHAINLGITYFDSAQVIWKRGFGRTVREISYSKIQEADISQLKV